jgi:hypothetical protein
MPPSNVPSPSIRSASSTAICDHVPSINTPGTSLTKTIRSAPSPTAAASRR